MAKKPILTEEAFSDEGPMAPAPLPSPVSHGVTRPVSAPAATAPTKYAAHPPSDPAASAGRDASGHARPKTRIHGYGAQVDVPSDAAAFTDSPTVGWLVVTVGPGRGSSFPLIAGMNAVGRSGELQVPLDFGDETISRDAHAYVTYDTEMLQFFISHAGKANLVRLNDVPVLTSDPLSSGDNLRIGGTSLRFVALCGPDFDWSNP